MVKKLPTSEIYHQRTKVKILTDSRQSNEFLTDNRHVDLPIQTLLQHYSGLEINFFFRKPAGD